MSDITIDPNNAADAAAALADEELGSLIRALMWELAVRTSEDQFALVLTSLRQFRTAMAPRIDTARWERELIKFAAEVRRDIDQLPEAPEPNRKLWTGMYL